MRKWLGMNGEEELEIVKKGATLEVTYKPRAGRGWGNSVSATYEVGKDAIYVENWNNTWASRGHEMMACWHEQILPQTPENYQKHCHGDYCDVVLVEPEDFETLYKKFKTITSIDDIIGFLKMLEEIIEFQSQGILSVVDIDEFEFQEEE